MKEDNENFNSYVIEDDDDVEKRYTLWSIVPQAMINPAKGWRKGRFYGPMPEIAIIRFLIPLCIIAGVSDFFTLLYPGQYTFAGILLESVITLCSYFIGYFLALVLSRILLPGNSRHLPSTDYGKLLIMGAMGTLAFFHVLIKALPMFDFLLEFLPLWTIFIVFEGVKQVDKQEGDKALFAIGLLCVIIICSPILVEWVLALFI